MLLKKAAKMQKGSGEPNREKVGKVTQAQVREIAEMKKAISTPTTCRHGDAHHRRHRAFDGHRGGGLSDGEARASVTRRPASRSTGRASTRWEAVALLKGLPAPKFDESVDIAVNSASIPSTPTRWSAARSCCRTARARDVRVLVFAKGDKEKEARDAGADHVGGEDLAKKIQDEGWLEFDRVIATPDMMGVVVGLGKGARPARLMPNPKLGTVTPDVGRAVSRAEGGQGGVPRRQDGIIHCAVGKRSFDASSSSSRTPSALIEAIEKAKPRREPRART